MTLIALVETGGTEQSTPILPVGSNGALDAKAAVLTEKQGHGQPHSMDVLSQRESVCGVVDIHHSDQRLLDSVAGRKFEFQKQCFSFCVFGLFSQDKQLAFPPIPGVHLNQLVQQALVHRSLSDEFRLGAVFRLSWRLYKRFLAASDQL